MNIRLFISWLLLLMILLLQPSPAAGQGGFPDVCQEDPNQLLANCGFSSGLSGWQTFVEAGEVSISTIDGDACHSPLCPAAHMTSTGSFVAGLYQQVPATPGTAYWANAVWVVYDTYFKEDGAFGRRIGIDPTGGTDPRSPAIVWGPEVWRQISSNQKILTEMQVSAVAQNSTITLFVRIDDTWKDRAAQQGTPLPPVVAGSLDQVWIDDVGLIATNAVPTPTPEPPTPTPVPPTPTPIPPTPEPTRIAPTDTPLPATETPTSEPSEVPTAAPTAVAQVDTPTPLPPTSTPTFTPTPLPPTPTSTPSPTATPVLPSNLELMGGGVLCLGGAGLGLVVVVGAFLFWLYRLGMSEEEEPEDWETENPEGDDS